MDVNEINDTIMLKRNNHVIPDNDETKEEQQSVSLHKEMDSEDDIPPSLLRYFETSKSRAAICEKLILEDPEDLTASHHRENIMNLPVVLNNDRMKPNVQVICDTEKDENNTSTDTRLLPSPTETEALFTHNVSVSPNSEDEYTQCERHLEMEYEAEREKRRCEEMKKVEEKRQIERDFQKELKKLLEAEKLHQKELELMGNRAQEKLEQELLLQQEMISNLQRRVEGERRMMEEEQKRMKDKEDKRRNEEEKIKIEAQKKKMEDETRRKKEEEIKIEEMKRKEEERKHEEEKRAMEREEKRKREEERNKKALEKKNLEDEMRMRKAEEERKRKEAEERIKKKEEEKREREEERKKIEEARKKMEEEKRKREEQLCQKEEDERKKIEEARKKMEKEKRKMVEQLSQKEEDKRKKGEEENMRLEEEVRRTEEMQEDMQEKKEEDEEALKKKRDEREHGNGDEELKLEVKKKEENERKRMDEEEEEARKREKERQKTTDKEVKEMVRKKAGERVKLRPIEEDERRKREDEINTKVEERRTGQKEEIGQEDGGNKVENESKPKDKDKQEAENKLEKKEMRRGDTEAEKHTTEEEVGGNKVNKKTEEEIRVKEKEEGNKRGVQGREGDERVMRANEAVLFPQEKTDNNSNNVDKAENTVVSQQEDSTTWTEAKPRQHHPEENTSQTSVERTEDCKYQAARPSTVSVSLPVCLPEHTEMKRLCWMKDCIPWSKLCLQNRRKQKGSARGRRGLRGAADASRPPPLCPHSLLQSTGWESLQQVTTVTLEDLPGCSLSTLTQCTQLQSLTLRRCGLKSLDSINQLPQLCYIDVQENDISFVDCENMTSLRVLRLGHNKLTSIHGLTGAENVDVLDLSHNSITRIAGLESLRRLQKLSVDHNQLISTKGLRDVYTLLHLNCSHNHLASVEGLENSALLNALDLRANSLTEPPSLNNQVLLRELHLDDNSISSLQGLTAYWLPLLQHFSVAQNGITQLPSMSDFVSLANLDLRFNCMSELQNVCESLEGCRLLREVHLTGNPLQQERGWRSSLQKAVPGLSTIDDQETDSFLTPPAVQQGSSASGSFLMFCRAQLQQTRDLQQQHIRELSNASSSLDAVKTSCQHLTQALQLAKDQRFAHEYGDTTLTDKLTAAGQITPEETPGVERSNAEKKTERNGPEMESTGKVQPVLTNRDKIRCKYLTFEEKLLAESQHDTSITVAADPKTGPAVNEAISGSVHSSATKGKKTSSNLEMDPVSNRQELGLQSAAAAMIQQQWSKYRQKCGNNSSPSTAEKGGGRGRGGGGGEPESGPSYINGSAVGQDNAATVIQAFWRGFTLRRRLASALAAVTCPDTGEDDTFEEVDVDEFVFDEAALEKHWTFSLTENSPPRRYPVPEEPLSPKPPVHFPEPSQYTLPPPLVWRPKQAWMSGEQVDSAGQRVSPESLSRSKSPASTSQLSGLTERSEKILEEWGFTDSHTALLMLKRAQKMKSAKQQQKKRRDPSVRLASFRNCSYQLGPVEAQNRPAQHNRNYIKVSEAARGLQQAEKVERVKQEQAQRWLHTQAAHSDRDSESEHFLPEISADILNGGRVQLVADPGYTQRLHHTSGLWANNSLAVQPCKEDSYPRRNSLGHAKKEVPSPRRVTSAPSKRERERISHRDNPVQLSGGWGGGKKRDKVYK